MAHHVEMQELSGVGVPGRALLVQLDAEPGSGRRDDVSVLPADRLLQDLRMEAAPGLDALLDQEVGAAGVDLDVCRGLDRSAVEMRSELRVVGLGDHAGLLGFEESS